MRCEVIIELDSSDYTDEEWDEIANESVTRCIDCKYFGNEKAALKTCRPGYCKPLGFCAWAVRKNG